MSRSRQHGEDLTYAEAHRNELPELYDRMGHRIDMANRDWTEFCHFCKVPLFIVEEVRDVGQDLLDKATTVTRQLAQRADIPASLLAWRTERPTSVQQEIDQLNRRIRQLEAAWPIVEFKVRKLYPQLERRLTRLQPEQWWEWLLILHRNHHRACPRAREYPVHAARFEEVLQRHLLHVPTLFGDGQLWRPAEGA